MSAHRKKRAGWMERASAAVTKATGSSPAFVLAVVIILVWGASGPVFHYSDTWQLVINTGTTIVTFLMVFLIQRAQNKDAQAVALKLDEIVASIEGASNRLIDVESLPEHDLVILKAHFKKLAEMAGSEGDITRSHSIDEAKDRHNEKVEARKSRPPKSR